jgi:hypothetical protein
VYRTPLISIRVVASFFFIPLSDLICDEKGSDVITNRVYLYILVLQLVKKCFFI